MNSMEEDALFESFGWTKNLIARRYESPRGLWLSFDDLVGLTETPEGEDTLRQLVAVYGEAQG